MFSRKCSPVIWTSVSRSMGFTNMTWLRSMFFMGWAISFCFFIIAAPGSNCCLPPLYPLCASKLSYGCFLQPGKSSRWGHEDLSWKSFFAPPPYLFKGTNCQKNKGHWEKLDISLQDCAHYDATDAGEPEVAATDVAGHADWRRRA